MQNHSLAANLEQHAYHAHGTYVEATKWALRRDK
jgi:hypothetical protein